MKDEQAEMLNDLLKRWQLRHIAPENGYYRENPACKMHRTSRQYDDANGALDADLESQRMDAVDRAIMFLEQPWRTAVMINAKNLACGYMVWSAPTLPKDKAERAELTCVARGKLVVLLEAQGIY